MSLKTQIFKLNNLKKLLSDENSCVTLVPTTRLLALPPFFLNDMKSGILYMLNNMLKKYDRSMGGIIIGYQNIKVLMDENTGIIPIGTSETEVNVSVEFYIFQPKIGSHLEGVINKKSNNHIGCLVHHYFNATILKPDSMDYEDWICKDFKVDDKIIFKVIDLDFTSLLPYIEGVIDDKNLLGNAKSNLHKNCDTNSLIENNVNNDCQNEILLPEEFLKNKKDKSKNEQVSILEENLNKNLGRKKKKKDKDKKKASVSASEKEKSPSDEEVTMNTTDLKSDKSSADEKKKKKKRNPVVSEKKSQENSAANENFAQEKNPCNLNNSIFTKSFQMENQSLSDFTETHKRKKEKKKKKDEKEKPMHFSPTPQGLPSKEVENSVLYSTLLDHIQTEKMRISFCSPIPQSTPAAVKKELKNSTQGLSSPVQIKSQNEVEKEKKKKQKKRQREEEKESLTFPASKKMKTLQVSPFREDLKDHNEKSEVQNITEELFRQQLKRVKEALNMSGKDSSLKENKKKGKIKKQDKELSHVDKNEKAQVNGESNVEKKSETQNLLDKLYKQELQRVKEQLSMTDRDHSLRKKTKMKMNKSGKNTSKEDIEDSSKESQNTKAQINGTNKREKKSAMQDLVEQLVKPEINRVKQDFRDSGSDSIQEGNKIKGIKNQQETSKEGTHNSLYEKLLNEAKSAIDLGKGKLPNLLPTVELGKNKSKKDNDLSDAPVSFSTKKNLKSKKKTEICLNAHDKYRNGSMYDLAPTPEKVHPDKSLFSDSEHSRASPFKRVKEANGIEAKTRKSLVQNMLDNFFEEKRKGLQSESDRDNFKKQEKKKDKTEQKSHDKSGKEESLYEKLLKEAKSLIDIEDQSVPMKKKKKNKLS